jgi:hypothetical protein
MSNIPEWHTTVIRIPSLMTFKGRNGVTYEASPLTKSGNIATRNKQKSIIFELDFIPKEKSFDKLEKEFKGHNTNIIESAISKLGSYKHSISIGGGPDVINLYNQEVIQYKQILYDYFSYNYLKTKDDDDDDKMSYFWNKAKKLNINEMKR